MAYNSTIRQKVGQCKVCDNGKSVPLIGGMCNTHYWNNSKLKSANKLAAKEDQGDDEDVATLKADLDIIYSKVIRLSSADDKGIVSCFICGNKLRWQDAQCMHFVSRGNSFLRFDNRNTKCGCRDCNEYKGGNLIEYAKQLEKQSPGVTDILLEEGGIVYKFTRTELKEMIAEYTNKLKSLQDQHGTIH